MGNNRIVANAAASVVQSTQYYPFGMPFADATGAGVQPYKYNNKELDQMHGLNLYDYSARYYESALGRFTSVDPLAEKYYSISPYAYVMNNPLKYIDPDGMSVHLNRLGYVVQENDDDDDGVYYHDDLSNWDSESTLDKKGTGIKSIGFMNDSGGTIDINDIYSNLLEMNISTAKSEWNPFWFKNIVKKGSDWDYKNNVNYIYGRLGDNDKLKFLFQGEIME